MTLSLEKSCGKTCQGRLFGRGTLGGEGGVRGARAEGGALRLQRLGSLKCGNSPNDSPNGRSWPKVRAGVSGNEWAEVGTALAAAHGRFGCRDLDWSVGRREKVRPDLPKPSSAPIRSRHQYGTHAHTRSHAYTHRRPRTHAQADTCTHKPARATAIGARTHLLAC